MQYFVQDERHLKIEQRSACKNNQKAEVRKKDREIPKIERTKHFLHSKKGLTSWCQIGAQCS